MPAQTKTNEFSLTTLARVTAALPGGRLNGCFTGVSTDSRTTEPGDCFFAISGENFDGHHYLDHAFQKGAACAVVQRNLQPRRHDAIVLKVDDTVRALGDFARWYRTHANFQVVAVTGSVGKTTTRRIIHHVLSRTFRVYQAPKNFNNQIGLPLTLLKADPHHDIVVIEIGANQRGEIEYLARIALPDIALITNVAPAHLAGFGDVRTIATEKLSIAEGLRPGGTLIINADCRILTTTARAMGLRFDCFGKSSAAALADHNLTDISSAGSAGSFTLDGVPVYLPLPGPGNIDNALAAWAVCSRFGISVSDYAQALRSVTAPPMRAELLQLADITVLNDCYNANPASMRNALQTLGSLSPPPTAPNRRLVFICGHMAELGTRSRRLHHELGRQIANAGVRLLLAVGQSTKVTADSAAAAGLETLFFDNAQNLCNRLRQLIRHGDIILVKGSRTAALETVVEKLKELFT